MTAGTKRVGATFWLLDAPDSLEVQSRRNVDGSGIGFFDPAGQPVLDKQPEAAFATAEFIGQAKQATSTIFVAHVRWATVGGRSTANTQPFAMRGRIMAHNGGFGEIARLDAQLGPYRELVRGQTDSERYFALITQQIDGHGGDVGAGITAAARWIASRLPVSSLNVILATPGHLWALRYPEVHALHIIERPAGDSVLASSATRPTATPGLHVRSTTSVIHAPDLHAVPTVVIASEELDGERGWRMLAPGELICVRSDLTVSSAVVLDDPPVRPMTPIGQNPNIDS
jgi:glutamine amidotransferase